MTLIGEINYIKMHLDILREFDQVPADIYLKLSENKVIKVVNSNSPYSAELLNHHSKKGIYYFYVLEEQFNTFSHKVACALSDKLEANSNASLVDKIRIQDAAVNLIMGELMMPDCISKSTERLLYNTLKSSISEAKKEPGLGSLLKGFMRRKDFLSSHSLFMSYIGNIIATKMGWKSDEVLTKIALCAILHDMALESTTMAKVYSKEQLAKLHGNDQLTVINHCFNAFKKLNKIRNLPDDIESILSSHHETPDYGFPGIVSIDNISELAAIIVMSEEFCTRVHGNENDREFLINLREEFANRYDVGNFKAPLIALLTVFDDMSAYSTNDK